jgi:DNA gyrase subunit A
VVAETKEVKDRFATPRKTLIIDSEQGHKAVVTGPVAPEGPQVVLINDEGVRTEAGGSYKDKVPAGQPSSRAVEVLVQRFAADPDARVILISAGGKLWKGNVARLAQGVQLQGDQIIFGGIADPAAKLVLATLGGSIKRVAVEDALKGVEASWAMIIGLAEEDQLVFAGMGSDEAQIFLYTEGATGEAKMLRFPASAVNPQATPSAKGMAGIKLPENEAVRGGLLFEPGSDKKALVLLTTEGLIRRVPLEEFPVQGRAGQGVQILKVTEATGQMAGVAASATDSSVDVYSAKGKRLRLEAKDIPAAKRAQVGTPLRRKFKDLFGGESLTRVVVLDRK